MVDSAASNSDTVVDSAVTVCPIRKTSGDNTHPCRNPAPTVNGCELIPQTRTQTSEQEYNGFTASDRRPSTPYSSSTPQKFPEELGPFFGLQKIFFPNLSEKLLCHKLSPYKFSVFVDALYFPLPYCHRLENITVRTSNLVLNTQLKKLYARLCQNIVRSQLAQHQCSL